MDVLRGVQRCLLALLMVTTLVLSSGCRLCCDPDDGSFSAYGGSWERTRRDGGRVGSLFDPGGAKIADLSPRDDVVAPDERSRILRGRSDAADAKADAAEDKPDEMDADEAAAQREQELQERLQKLRDEGMENINIIPGEPLPPSVY
ncbi:hypothetical protein [Stieleria varia]|nr:hypothetical protein [Stieleria varia]